jgi:hypothetical protein
LVELGLEDGDGSEEEVGDGGSPMMPPSMKRIAGAEDWKSAAISRAVRGETAFRSR